MPAFLRNPRVLAGLGVVVLLLLVALWPETAAVDLAPVVRGAMEVTIDEEGETRVRERFLISAPVAGRVLRIELEPGDPVRRGETVVATVLPAPIDARAAAEARAAAAAAEAAIGRARAEKGRMEAAQELARAELARNETLFAQAMVSREQLDARRTEVATAEAAVRAAEFALAAAQHERDMAQARLLSAAPTGSTDKARPLTLKATVDGVVLKRYRESEAVVPAGEPLLELGRHDDIEVVADLLSTDAVRVRPGQEVRIEQWGGDTRLRGRVRRVEPSGFMKISALGVEEQRVNVVIDIEAPPDQRAPLGDGYRVEVRIVVWSADAALKVPTSSLFRRGEAWAVFLVEGGRARLRTIELGRRNAADAEVLSGLEDGDEVIAHPGDTIEDGTRVTKRKE